MEPYYEKLDFDEDPFTTNPKKFINKLVNMDSILEETYYRIDSGNMLVIEGFRGSGRTSLLMNAAKRYGGFGRVIYVDCEKVDKKLNITTLLLNRYSILGRLFRKKPKNMILLLDNVQNLSKINNDRIKYYYDQNYFKSVIFTCIKYSGVKFSKSLKDRIGTRVVKIDQIDESDAIDIIRNRINGSELLTDELIVEIFKKSKKNPKTMLENCRRVAEKIAENSRDRIKFIDIERALGDKNE
ncbi:AAA family ATPase [Candidatus Woesearchaeota archaeon]|nr:AAA family ATPase [Candidatus Woesearchaeota archaeon]